MNKIKLLVTSFGFVSCVGAFAETLPAKTTEVSDTQQGTFMLVADKMLKLNIQDGGKHPILDAKGVYSNGVLAFSTTSRGLTGSVGVKAAEGYYSTTNTFGDWTPHLNGAQQNNVWLTWLDKTNTSCIDRTNGDRSEPQVERNNGKSNVIWCKKGSDVKDFRPGYYTTIGTEITAGTYTIQLVANEYTE